MNSRTIRRRIILAIAGLAFCSGCVDAIRDGVIGGVNDVFSNLTVSTIDAVVEAVLDSPDSD